MPGVSIRTATRSGPVNTPVPETGRYFVAGITKRGPAGVATKVRSLAEFEVLFGGRVPTSYLYDDLRTFFEEGGTEAQVARVAGSGTVGTLTLKDTAVAPADALRIDAIGPGSWSSDVSGGIGKVGDRLTLNLALGGEPAEAFIAPTIEGLVGKVNAESRLVRLTMLGGDGTIAEGTIALSAGTDDNDVTASDVLDVIEAAFGMDLGTGAVAAPGYSATAVGERLVEFARATRRIALLHSDKAATGEAADVTGARMQADADALLGLPGSEHAGLFGPWVSVPVGSSVNKITPPTGYVAAMRARAHQQVGPWRVPAGEIAIPRFVNGLEVEFSRTIGDALNDSQVSVIRTVAGAIRLYGWRSLSTDLENYTHLIGVDVVNSVANLAEAALETYVFQPIDGKGMLYASVNAALIGILEPIRAAGGLFERIAEDGSQIDPGYSVDTGPTVNTIAVQSRSTIAAVVALRVSPVGELIDVTIVKAALGATV